MPRFWSLRAARRTATATGRQSKSSSRPPRPCSFPSPFRPYPARLRVPNRAGTARAPLPLNGAAAYRRGRLVPCLRVCCTRGCPRAPGRGGCRGSCGRCASGRRRGNVQGSGGEAATDVMAASADLYAVLGLKKECTDAELKLAYRKLAMIWHPDRCSASGSSARVEEAKARFQEIQGAYSVLSDSNKRFLYDVGVYDSQDDEDDMAGMGDFLGEMADMMSQATPTESFEELQQLFVDMFQDDIMVGICAGPLPGQPQAAPCTSVQPPLRPPTERANQRTTPSRNVFSKSGSSAMGSGKKPSSRSGRAGMSTAWACLGSASRLARRGSGRGRGFTTQAAAAREEAGGNRGYRRAATSPTASHGGAERRGSRRRRFPA